MMRMRSQPQIGVLQLALLSALVCWQLALVPVAGMLDTTFGWHLLWLWLAAAWAVGRLACPWARAWGLYVVGHVMVASATRAPVLVSYAALAAVIGGLYAAQGFATIRDNHLQLAMIACALTAISWMAWQQAGVIHWPHPSFAGRLNANAAACLLAMTLPATLDTQPRKWLGRWRCPLALLPIWAAGLMLAASSTGVVSALVAVGVWACCTRPNWPLGGFWGDNRKLVIATAFGFIAIAGFFWLIDPPTPHELRFEIWRRSAVFIADRPWGRGLAQGREILAAMYSNLPGLPRDLAVEHLHNEWIEAIFEMGWFAALLPAVFVLAALRRAKQCDTPQAARAAAGLAATAVAACGYYTMHTEPTALVGLAWLGAYNRVAETLR